MGFTKPDFPDVDPDEFLAKPLMERMRILALNWVENGFGSPKMVHTVYIVKLVFFYALGGDPGRHADLRVARVLACLGVVEPADRLREGHPVDGAAGGDRCRRVLGPAGRQGQTDDRGHPVLGSPGHHPAAAVEGVPFTAGDRRTRFDVVLYVTLLVSVAIALLPPGVHSDSLSAVLPTTLRPGQPGASRRADRAAGGDGTARQDHLPGCAR